MTDLEALNLRSSRRHFKGLLPHETLDLVEHLLARVNSESSLDIQLVRSGAELFGGFFKTYGRFRGVNSFLSMSGYTADPYLREKAGYYGQKLLLELTKLGLGSCWVAMTYDHSKISQFLKDGQEAVAVIVFGNVGVNNHLQEVGFTAKTQHSSKTVAQMSIYKTPPPPWFLEGVAAACKAPSAFNKQPVVFCWEKGVARAQIPEKRAHEHIDLGIAKRHFEIATGGRFQLGNSAPFAFLVSGGEP